MNGPVHSRVLQLPLRSTHLIREGNGERRADSKEQHRLNFAKLLNHVKRLPSYKTESVEKMAHWAVIDARKGNPWVGLGLAYVAHQRAVENGQVRGMMLALNACAMCHAMRHDEMTAIAAAVDAFDLAHRLGDESGLGHALTTIVGGTTSAEMFPDAADVLNDIIHRALAASDLDLEIRARVGRCIVLGDQRSFKLAEAELAMTLRLQRMYAPDRFSVARLLLNHANLHRKRLAQLAQYATSTVLQTAASEARAVCVDAMAHAVREDNRPVEILGAMILGFLYRITGDFDSAIQVLTDAIPRARLHYLQGQLPDILSELAEVHRAAGNTPQYVATLEAALVEAEGKRPTRRLESLCRKLAAQAHCESDAAREAVFTARAINEAREFAHIQAHAQRSIDALKRRIPARDSSYSPLAMQ